MSIAILLCIVVCALAGLYLLAVAIWPVVEVRLRRRAARRAWRAKR